MGKRKAIVPVERIEKAILFIRGEKILLNRHLADESRADPFTPSLFFS